jgi:hypothetical protein
MGADKVGALAQGSGSEVGDFIFHATDVGDDRSLG